MKINILTSNQNHIYNFIKISYENNVSSCTMLNHIFNSLIMTLDINDKIDINTINLFVNKLISATSHEFIRIRLYYSIYQDLIHFFKPILFIHQILLSYTTLLYPFPFVITKIIFKYVKSNPKKVLTFSHIQERNFRHHNWIKIGTNKWAMI